MAEASGSISFDFSAKGTQFGDTATFSRTVSSYGSVSANMSADPIKAIFTN
jgi:hypothetical protein